MAEIPLKTLKLHGLDNTYYIPDAQSIANQALNDAKSYTNELMKKAAPRNLLDNSDFTDLVAQAGFLGIHGSALYLADRWFVNSSGISYDNINRVITFTASNTPLMLAQIVSSNLSGKTITLAIKASSVMGKVSLSENGAESGHADVRITDGITTHTFVGGEQTRVLLWSKEDASLCIDWIALYEGEYTEDTIPEYQPKGYGAELMECQRYYVGPVNFIITKLANLSLEATFVLPVPMRVKPTATIMSNDGTVGSVSRLTNDGWVDVDASISMIDARSVRVSVYNIDTSVTLQGKIIASADL